MTPNVWDYVLLKAEYNPETMPIPIEKLNELRNEFEYWYPVDMRGLFIRSYVICGFFDFQHQAKISYRIISPIICSIMWRFGRLISQNGLSVYEPMVICC
jgi:hypothetical protein